MRITTKKLLLKSSSQVLLFTVKRVRLFTLLLIVILLSGINSKAQVTILDPAGGGGFELGPTPAANGWSVVNATTYSNWCIGNMGIVTQGINGAFISSTPAGLDNAYINTPCCGSAYSHIYTDVTFPAGAVSITLSFKWRGVGESIFDYLNVYFIPTAQVPVTTGFPTGNTIATNLNLQNSIQVATYSLPVATYAGTTQRLCFSWKSDYSVLGFPAASIDEVSVTAVLPVPCNATPVISGPSATPNTFNCSGAPALNLTTFPNPNNVSGITYQWQSSPANQNIWSSISLPLNAPPFTAPSINANTDYRVIAECTATNQSVISSTVTATVVGVNALPDSSNICLGNSKVLTATAPAVNGTLFSENFNAANSMVITTSGTGGTEFIVQPNNYNIPCRAVTFNSPSATNFALTNPDNQCVAGSTTNTQLTSPLLNTTGYSSLTLNFNHYFRYLTGQARVEVSIDGGANWTTVQSYGATVGTSNGFVPVTINLNAYINQPNFKVRFNMICGWDWWWAIDDVALTGLGGTPSFSWVANPAATAGLPAAAATMSPSNSSITVTPTAVGTYTYTVTSNAAGCATDFAIVNVTPGTSAAISFTSATICSGRTDTVLFTGTPNATVTYKINAGPNLTITLDASGNAFIVTPALTNTTIYTLVSVSNASGCVTPYNTVHTITVNPQPVMNAGQPSSNTPVCSGTPLNLFVSTTPASSTYSWTGPAFGTPNTSQSPVVPNALVAHSGTYTVTATTAAGCSVTGTTTVLVNQSPAINVMAVNTGSCGGNDGSIMVSGLLPNDNYTLGYTGATAVTTSIISNGTGAYTINNLSAGIYTSIYVVKNNCTSNIVNVVINDPPAPVISNVAFSDPLYCGGTNGSIVLQTLLANTAYDVYYNNNATPVNFTANASGSLVVTGLAAGTYNNIYVVRVNCTSNVVGPVTLTEPGAPNPPTPIDVVYCQYDVAVPLTATVSDTFDSPRWYTSPSGGVPVTSVTPPTNVPGNYIWYVTEITPGGCESQRVIQNVWIKPKPSAPITTIPSFTYCQFDSMAVPLVATGDSLAWYTVSTGGTPSYTALTPSTDVAGVFTFYVTQADDGCESDRLPIVVTIVDKPDPPVVKDLTYCQFDIPSALTAIGNDLKWFDVPTGGSPIGAAPTPSTALPGTTTWYVSQTVNGCESDRAAITVVIFYRPTAEIVTSRDELCQGDTLLVSYVGNGSQTTTYNWAWPIGSSIVSGQGQGPYVVRFVGIGPRTITLTATENGCSSPEASRTIIVNQVPDVTIALRNNIVCVGDPAYIDITSSNMAIANYLWTFNGAQTSTGANTANGPGPYYFIWDQPGTYTVSLDVASADNCFDRAEETVVVHEHPNVKINAPGTNDLCSGEDVILSASVNNPRYTYKWEPVQFFDFNENNAVVTIHADNSRYVTLTTSNEFGCTSMDSIMLTTKPCCELLLPSAFSPNGDGKNDLFRILNPGRHKLESLKVYNRYGQIVYSTSNEKDGWNGSFNGVAQEMGTYQYLVRYDCEGKATYLKGEVTLVR